MPIRTIVRYEEANKDRSTVVSAAQTTLARIAKDAVSQMGFADLIRADARHPSVADLRLGAEASTVPTEESFRTERTAPTLPRGTTPRPTATTSRPSPCAA